ncbi:hypothetical protein I600_1829 [Maribacter dokdonensis DSW-8]|nr:hypothetical protein I600_1829 [Maribacter dokdonensis DSW-8]
MLYIPNEDDAYSLNFRYLVGAAVTKSILHIKIWESIST